MLTVSNYHYIRESYDTKYPSIFGVTPPQFQNQLQLLKNEGDFISSIDLLANLDEALSSKDNFIFITFDDGLKEQFDFALPILDALEIPAIFFANSRNFQQKKASTVHKIHLLRTVLAPSYFLKLLSDFKISSLSEYDINRAKNIYRFDDEKSAILKFLLNFKMDFHVQEKIIGNVFELHFEEQQILEEFYMDKKNIVDLAEKGFLGSHTHNHYPLGLLEKDKIHFELNNSKEYFEKITNSTISIVAYPYGTDESCTKEVVEVAQVIGYKIGFTTRKGLNFKDINPLMMNRYDCNDLLGGKNYK